MPPAIAHALVFAFSAALALWPLAFLAGAVWHGLARRWQVVARLAMLLPLWCVAASIGLMQGPRVITLVNEGPAAITRPGMAIAATVFALSFAGLAWALLLRALRPAHR